MRPTLEHLRILATIYKKTPFFRKQGAFFTFSCFFEILSTLKMYDFYRAYLNPDKTKAVVTLCDAHPHEAAITKAAKGKGIPTFTLQHGIFGAMHTPVHSDRIFVWGEITKQKVMRLGVPAEKIVISGRPLLDEAAAKCQSLAPSLRTAFRKRHPRRYSSGPVVTFIAGNIEESGEESLLAAFSALWSLGILLVVRLKPTIAPEQEQWYRDQINKLGGASEVYVSKTDDLYELLAVSDVVIGFVSSVVVEAMAFGCIPVLLDILSAYDLRALLSHYDDCLIARDAAELHQLIRRITEDRDYFQQLKSVYAATASRYFGGEPGVPATRFIRDYIMNFTAREAP
jgi:glycosyltransferase involved in cell wall biosynthesis